MKVSYAIIRITYRADRAGGLQMESIYLKTLLEVVKTGSFSKAAESLCVTQPSVSRRIKFLEDQYGYPLLDRLSPVPTPTEAGRIVLENAEKMLVLEKKLLFSLRNLDGKPSFSLCCTPTFGIAYLPDILKDFMLKNANLNEMEFIFDFPEKAVHGLRENLFDVAIIEHCECFDLADFDTYSLPGDEMVFISAPQLGIPAPETSIDLLMEYCLYGRKEGCCSQKLLAANLEGIGRDTSGFRRVIVYDDLHVIINSVLDGSGIAFISSSLVERHIKEGRLVAHTVDGFRHSRKRTLIANGPVPPKSGLEIFLNCLCRSFDQQLPPFVGCLG